MAAAKLHVAHEMEGEVWGWREGLVQVFGDEQFLAVLVAEGLSARGRVEHIPMEGDFALDLPDFYSGDFADVAAGFELWDKAVKAFVVGGTRPELVPEQEKGAQAVEVVKTDPGLPREHGFVADVLVDLRAVLQGHSEVAEAVLDHGTVAVVTEPFGVSGGGLEIEEQEDAVLPPRVIIPPQEKAPEVAGAELAADLLEEIESEADGARVEENDQRVDAEGAREPATQSERFACVEDAPDLQRGDERGQQNQVERGLAQDEPEVGQLPQAGAIQKDIEHPGRPRARLWDKE